MSLVRRIGLIKASIFRYTNWCYFYLLVRITLICDISQHNAIHVTTDMMYGRPIVESGRYRTIDECHSTIIKRFRAKAPKTPSDKYVANNSKIPVMGEPTSSMPGGGIETDDEDDAGENGDVCHVVIDGDDDDKGVRHKLGTDIYDSDDDYLNDETKERGHGYDSGDDLDHPATDTNVCISKVAAVDPVVGYESYLNNKEKQ